VPFCSGRDWGKELQKSKEAKFRIKRVRTGVGRGDRGNREKGGGGGGGGGVGGGGGS